MLQFLFHISTPTHEGTVEISFLVVMVNMVAVPASPWSSSAARLCSLLCPPPPPLFPPFLHLHPCLSRSTILVVLTTNKQPLAYEPGDHVGIFPSNNSRVVSELLSRLKFDFSPDEPFTIERRRESLGETKWVPEKRFPVPVTLREAFTYYLDLSSPPSPQFLKLLKEQATKLADKEDLEELSRGGDSYEDWKYGCFPSLLDVLNQFHSLKIDVTFLLQQLPLLQCVSDL